MPEMIAYIRDNYPYIKHVQLEPVQDKGQYKKTYYDKFVEGFIQAYIVGRQCGIDVYNMITHSIGTIKSQFCRGEFCLTPEGRIVSCQRFSSDKDELFSKFEFGKVLNGKVEIDNNSYKQVASMFSSKLPQCETCFVKYNCAGMCTAVRSDLAEEQVSEYCNFIKNLVKQMLLTYNM